jgi:hypothetical protein
MDAIESISSAWRPPTIHVHLVKSLFYGQNRRMCLAVERCRRSGLWISSWVWDAERLAFRFAERVRSIVELPEGYFVTENSRLGAIDEEGREYIQRHPNSCDLDFVSSNDATNRSST